MELTHQNDSSFLDLLLDEIDIVCLDDSSYLVVVPDDLLSFTAAYLLRAISLRIKQCVNFMLIKKSFYLKNINYNFMVIQNEN